MAPLEPWERVLIDDEMYPATVHGHIACTECHGGEQTTDKSLAHMAMVVRPSEDSETNCGECHPDVVDMNQFSLHNNLAGYWVALDARSAPEGHEQLSQMFDNHCNDCHTSCGDCHVSQPASVGGGFVDGHNFNAKPSMTRNCTACHGSRVGNEYLGKHDDLKADIHFRQGRMTCVDCHSGHEMHGQPAECTQCHTGPEEQLIPPAEHRYDGVQSPRCETCHVTASTGQDGLDMHNAHGSDLSCQVCHSVSYTSCDGCHVSISDRSGNPIFATEGSYLTFLIGRNPLPTFDRPYKFVPLRHVPIDQDSFSYYGDDLLPNFESLPTWAYATPHNVQLETPQTESCDACHGNPDLFLTADKVAESELAANRAVIVERIPAPVDEITKTLELTSGSAITGTQVITGTEGTR